MSFWHKCKTREPTRRRVSSNVGNFKKERRLTRNKKKRNLIGFSPEATAANAVHLCSHWRDLGMVELLHLGSRDLSRAKIYGHKFKKIYMDGKRIENIIGLSIFRLLISQQRDLLTV